MALFLLPFTLRHQIDTQIAKTYQELACTGLKHWILLESTLLGGREFQDEMVHGNTCFFKFLVKRRWGVSGIQPNWKCTSSQGRPEDSCVPAFLADKLLVEILGYYQQLLQSVPST